MTHQQDINCRKILNDLSAYIDGDLNAETCRKFEQHLENCRNCRVVVDTLKKTISIYQWDGKETGLPDDIRERLLSRFALNDEND